MHLHSWKHHRLTYQKYESIVFVNILKHFQITHFFSLNVFFFLPRKITFIHPWEIFFFFLLLGMHYQSLFVCSFLVCIWKKMRMHSTDEATVYLIFFHVHKCLNCHTSAIHLCLLSLPPILFFFFLLSFYYYYFFFYSTTVVVVDAVSLWKLVAWVRESKSFFFPAAWAVPRRKGCVINK